MKHIIIHHNDNDGRLAAFIMAEHLRDKQRESSESTFITFIEADYRKEIDLSGLAGHHVYILDYSLPPDQMVTLNICCHLVWIDHHKTAIEANANLENTVGIRNTRYCGAMLTWMHVNLDFKPDHAPYCVRLVDDYDCWKHKTKDGRAFHAGSQLYDTRPIGTFWCGTLFYHAGCQKIAIEGEAIIKYQAQTNADRLRRIGWTSTWENRRCLCLNGVRGSDAFGPDAFVQHPILVAYYHDGDKFEVSLYSDPASGINVGEIAKQHGGGGHPNAAGFICKTLPMIKEASYVAR